MTAWLALARAWDDLLRPQILRLLLIGVALTILLFVVLQAGAFWLVRLVTPGSLTLPWIGTIDIGNALSWGSLALFPVMGFFLMAPVAAAFSGIFAENVAERVEAIHYPDNPGQPLDMVEGLLDSLGVIGAVLGVAVLSLLVTPLLGPLAPVLFYGANGWLLGREFFQMAARRHLHAPQATEMRRAHGLTITGTGVMIAVLLTVPVLNIAVPVLAAAAFTHLFHLIRGSSDTAPRYVRG